MSEAAAHVRDSRNEMIGDEVHDAVVVAQAHVTQGDLLHQARLAGCLDHIILADLVLEQDKETDEVVLNQALRAKAYGQAYHSCRAEYGRDGDAELGQNQHRSDQAHDYRHDVAECPL
jgi:hypothetical protein